MTNLPPVWYPVAMSSKKYNTVQGTQSVRVSCNLLQQIADIAQDEDRTIRSVMDMAMSQFIARRVSGGQVDSVADAVNIGRGITGGEKGKGEDGQ